MNIARMTALHIVLAGAAAAASCQKPTAPTQTSPAGGRIAVTVDGQGYHPSTFSFPAGRPATIVFTRTSDDGCGQQLVFPSLNIRRDLPLNEPVEVTVPPPTSGSIAFTCGMNMYRGSIVAQ